MTFALLRTPSQESDCCKIFPHLKKECPQIDVMSTSSLTSGENTLVYGSIPEVAREHRKVQNIRSTRQAGTIDPKTNLASCVRTTLHVFCHCPCSFDNYTYTYTLSHSGQCTEIMCVHGRRGSKFKSGYGTQTSFREKRKMGKQQQ